MARGRRRRVVLAAAVLVTAAAVLLDLGDPGWAGRLRSAGATTLGPVISRLGPPRDDEPTRARLAAALTADTARRDSQRAVAAQHLADLLASPSLTGARLVAARVVAVGAQGASGPQRVTLDVGSRDGVTPELSVVTADGLVGRTVSVAPWTTDVLLVGAGDLTVGVRAGTPGALGMLGATSTSPRAPGELSLALVARGSVQAGDMVRTLGSPSGRPFVAGIPVGVVTSVDDPRGRVGVTAAVRPLVDAASLDVVAVLLAAPRSTPRASTTAGAP